MAIKPTQLLDETLNIIIQELTSLGIEEGLFKTVQDTLDLGMPAHQSKAGEAAHNHNSLRVDYVVGTQNGHPEFSLTVSLGGDVQNDDDAEVVQNETDERPVESDLAEPPEVPPEDAPVNIHGPSTPKESTTPRSESDSGIDMPVHSRGSEGGGRMAVKPKTDPAPELSAILVAAAQGKEVQESNGSFIWTSAITFEPSDKDNTSTSPPPSITIAFNMVDSDSVSATLEQLTTQLTKFSHDFTDTLTTTAATISLVARPLSSTTPSSFRPRSISASAVTAPTPPPLLSGSGSAKKTRRAMTKRSELYAWRAIFGAYTEAEIFLSEVEVDRGERPVREARRRLEEFERLVRKGGEGTQLWTPESRGALETVLELNWAILRLKEFQETTFVAVRSILKSIAERAEAPTDLLSPEMTRSPSTSKPPTPAALPSPPSSTSPPPKSQPASPPPSPQTALLGLLPITTSSLPRTLLRTLHTTLLPVLPHATDHAYTCPICADLAFRPVRLSCGHLFCVRCLTKMQKRRKALCAVCRAPTVLAANRGNVDLSMQNFMQDWFPIEARRKQRENVREAKDERDKEIEAEYKRRGFDRTCVVC